MSSLEVDEVTNHITKFLNEYSIKITNDQNSPERIDLKIVQRFIDVIKEMVSTMYEIKEKVKSPKIIGNKDLQSLKDFRSIG